MGASPPRPRTKKRKPPNPQKPKTRTAVERDAGPGFRHLADGSVSWRTVFEKGGARHRHCLELILNAPLASPDELDDLAQTSPLLHALLLPLGWREEERRWLLARLGSLAAFGRGERPRDLCDSLAWVLQDRIAKGLAPRQCAWERCHRGRDGGRRWFLPTRKSQTYCCDQCRTDAANPDPTRPRPKT